jgi:UDP-GlcNAc:undecaprenyl-phosphate GlcNAc-1-phosphate transferase
MAAILRRKLTGRSIYSTDRGHLHHCLLRSGLSRPRALAIVSGLCLLTVLGVLASIAWQNEALALLSAAAVVAILVLSRLFGHSEMVLVLKSAGVLARSLSGGPHQGHQVEVRLQGSADWRVLWQRLLSCAERLNLRGLVLDVNAPAVQEGYHARWFRTSAGDGREDAAVWLAEIPLTAAGQSVGRVTITGERDGEAVWRKLAAIAEIAEQIEAVLETWPTPRAAGVTPKHQETEAAPDPCLLTPVS